jgi:membrane protein YdbS with pleckstrin-like domain
MSDGQHALQVNPAAATVYLEPSEKLDPRSRRVWLIGDLIGAVVVTAIVAGIMFMLDWWLDLGRVWSIGVPVVLGLAQLAWAIIRPEIEFRQWRFEIREDEVDLLHGVITRTRQVVPMSRIQHVDTERGPIQRRYGLSTVKFFTAAGAMEIPQLSDERADAVRDQIATLAKVHDDI